MTLHDGNDVAFESKAYKEDQEDRNAILALRSSTSGMRDAGIEYLPKEDREEDTRWQARRDRSFLFGALDDTIDKLVSKPFAQEVTIRGTLPEKLEPMLRNVDLAGTTLTQFARRLFDAGVGYGLSHVFVDFQQTGGTQKKDKEQKGEVRPYFVFVDPVDLIGWKEWTAPNGEKLIVELRWREIRQETDGKYGTKDVNYIRVVANPPTETGFFELHREKDDDAGEYALVPEASGPFLWNLPGLPFFTHYTDRVAFMRAKPPMLDLMWKNIQHWQQSSDKSQALRFASLIQLHGRGIPKEVVESGLPLGHGAVHLFQSPDTVLEWLEASGSSIEVLESAIDKLVEEMETLGKNPLLRKTANTTATSQKSSDDKNEAPIQAWVRDLASVLRDALVAAGLWVGATLPDDTAPEVFNEFKLTGSRTDIVKSLLDMRKAGDISHELFLTEIKKHGFISDEVDVEKEIAKVLEEKERMAEMFAPEIDPDDDDDDDDPDPNDPDPENDDGE
jgi:hypothetical protein